MRAIVMMFTAGAIGFAAPATAQTTQEAFVATIRTGWNDDLFAVVPNARIANPARCRTADGYLSHKSLPGYDTYYAAALAAIANRHRVQFIVHDTECFGDRPMLIGINLRAG